VAAVLIGGEYVDHETVTALLSDTVREDE